MRGPVGVKLVPATAVRLGVWADLWCQQPEQVGSQCKLLEQVRVFATSHWCRNGVCPENQLLGGTRVSEASQGLSAGAWGRTAGHSTSAWCQLLWRQQGGESLYLPQT